MKGFYRMGWLCGLSVLLACSMEAGRGHRADAVEPGAVRKLDVTRYGAKGDGKTDDSRAIQAVLDSAAIGDTVYLPKGTYLVRTLRLVPNVHVVAEGTLRQSREWAARFSVEKQHSDAPLFRAHRISNVYLSVRAETVNEAIYASESSNITIAGSRLTGDSTNSRSFAAVLWYSCSACRVVGTTITQYGSRRTSPGTYGYGTAIRVLSSRGVTLSGNTLSHNGENGVFIHDSGDVEIDGNHIHHNGMSGIQVAFNRADRVANYRITNNRLEYNAADAVDINNRAHGRVVEINTLIAGNHSRSNGFVDSVSTPDGSGIATLIGVSGVTLSGNRAFGNNRPALYVEGCGTVTANRNVTDGEFELVGQWDAVLLRHNTFNALRLLANAQGHLLDMRSNRVQQLMLPNGIRIDSLHMQENTIARGPVNVNMQGYLTFEDNRLRSGHDAGALLLMSLQGALVKGNRITNADNAAITVRHTATDVAIDSNFVTSGGVWLRDLDAPGLRVSRNQVREHIKAADPQ